MRMHSNRRKSANRELGTLGLAFFTLIWCAFVGFVDWKVGISIWSQARSHSFHEGTAEILKSEVTRKRGSKGRSNYGLEVQYRYEVDGREYLSERYAFQSARSSDSKWAYAAVHRIPSGATVPVFYDPANPERAVLRRGLDGSDLMFLLFLTPFNVVGIALVAVVAAPLFNRGGFPKVTSERFGRERIYVGDGGPFTVLLGILGLTSFVAIFCIAIPFGFHPPMNVIVTVLTLVVGGSSLMAFRTWRDKYAGKNDLLIDQPAGLLIIPPMHGRKLREEIPFNEVASFYARKVRSPLRGKKSATEFGVVLSLRNGVEHILKKPASLRDAERWADWLSRKTGAYRVDSQATGSAPFAPHA